MLCCSHVTARPRLVAVLMTALLTLLALAIKVPLSEAADVEQMKASTVFVLCTKANGQQGNGSGFVVGGGKFVVTNAHVVNGFTSQGDSIDIVLEKDRTVRAHVLVANVAHKDLAVLELTKEINRPSVTFAPGDTVKSGDKVLAMGFPAAATSGIGNIESLLEVRLSDGIISGKDVDTEGIKRFSITAPLNPGNSGGPLFNERGHVIGVNVQKSLTNAVVVSPDGSTVGTQRVPLGEGIAWAIQADELMVLLDRLNIPYPKAKSPSEPEVVPVQPGPDKSQEPTNSKYAIFAGIIALIILIAVALYMHQKKSSMQRPSVPPVPPVPPGSSPYGVPPAGHPAPVMPTAPRGRPILRGITGEYAGSVLELREGTLTMGRDPKTCQLVFSPESKDVGRMHCTVRYENANQNFLLEDANSVNGTFLISGERLVPREPRRLRSGDRFYLSTQKNLFEVRLE
ncbi:FHA domain-containing protein [Heliobacterium undosum]|uniref:FHA domain-containing protein n=1 Tax=Heliomicrobium undosum TaxID=121734 RepID=A0A845L0V7_9FIRM|nr:trypsin-like peptidase domain-containing protein [Heliomicrobium undosum]MZP29823.1 FHA domain-containing protein [Heliomicrobium undosum]